MFQYLWPETVVCEKCHKTAEGSTLVMSEEPIYSVCGDCDPISFKDARTYANNSACEEFINAWDWIDDPKYSNS